MEISRAADSDLPTDVEIHSIIEDTYNWDPELDDRTIEVTVNDGWVTLRGTVDTYWKKLRAAEKSSAIRGVHGMTNELAVVPTRSVTDQVLAEGIVEAVERDIRVNVDGITVVVEEGGSPCLGSSQPGGLGLPQKTRQGTPLGWWISKMRSW